jgi:predicted RNase H-like HicB family nuclease/predicted DNA-binding transcriptional regulator AlpA
MTHLGALFERTPEGVWVATCPSVPGAFAQGRTIPQCRKKLRDAIASLLVYAPADDLQDLRESEIVLARAELIDISVPEREVEELVSQSDIARMAEVSRQAVHVWIDRPGFPRSVGRSGTGARWRRSDVLRWLASGRKAVGRPSVREEWPPGAVRS